MADPADLGSVAQEFLLERSLASLTTLGHDGRPHVVPIGFTWDAGTTTVRIITSDGTQKVRNVERSGHVAICQYAGRHWLTLRGTGRILRDATSVRDAEERYAQRYRQPRVNPRRVVIVVDVAQVLGDTATLHD